jgi:hypothetical protein
LVAALAGAAGGAVGAGVVWGLSRVLGKQPKWATFVPIACAMAAVALVRNLEPTPGEQAMAALDESATIQALRTHYPEDYAKLATRVHAVAASAGHEEASGVVSGVLSDVMARQRAKANVESARGLYAITRMEGQALRAADPAACAAFMDGRDASTALGKVLTPDIVARDREAAAGLLVQTAEAPAPLAAAMPMDQLLKLSMEAVSTMPDTDQDLAIAVLKASRNPATPEENRVMCDFNLALADAILSRPPAVAGGFVRGLWAMR